MAGKDPLKDEDRNHKVRHQKKRQVGRQVQEALLRVLRRGVGAIVPIAVLFEWTAAAQYGPAC